MDITVNPGRLSGTVAAPPSKSDLHRKCIAAAYSSIDINGDGVYWLAEIGISSHLYRMLPYIITLLVLAFTSKSSRAPKAEGIPYDKGQR